MEIKQVQDSDNGYFYDNFFVTEKGKDWLLNNQHKLNLKIRPYGDSSFAQEAEITDEDIPF